MYTFRSVSLEKRGLWLYFFNNNFILYIILLIIYWNVSFLKKFLSSGKSVCFGSNVLFIFKAVHLKFKVR